MWISLKQKKGTDIVMGISGMLVVITCAIVEIGHLTNVNLFFDYHPGYIPMAPSSAIIFTFYGLLLVSNLQVFTNRTIRPYALALTFLLTIFGLLKFIEAYTPFNLTFEQFLTSNVKYLGVFPLGRMSPYSGLLFFISGSAFLIKYYARERLILLNLICILGLIIMSSGFVASLGYVFKTPFLYSGNLIPLAESTAIAFLILGIGLIALSGEKTFFVRQLTGPKASARILRAFLPLMIMRIVLNDWLDLYITNHYYINPALVSALVTMISLFIAIIVILYITKIIFKSAHKAEAERVKAEEALQESLELSNSLLHSIPFGMDIVDESGTILFQSEIFKNQFNVESVGAKCWDVYRDDKTQCKDCPLNEEIKIGITTTKETDGVLGGRTFAIVHTGLMYQKKKAVLEIFHDITERKQSEIQLNKYTEELKMLNNTKDKLFSIIAHDLKSPFNSILGLTQLLNDQYEEYNDDEKKLIISKIKDSSKKMFNLLENLLIWSIAQRNGINVNAEKIDLYEIANIQMGVFVTVARSKNIHLANNIARGTFAYADGDLVKTILLNLINNAIKFTHLGGNVNLEARTNNDIIEISVTDNGIGIDNQVLNTLFKSASAYSTMGTSNEKGTGLGLMVCKEFAELNGGIIWVESEQGKGSRFTFTLPLLS